MWKYISKSHLIVLMVLVVIVGIMLLLGEHYSAFSTEKTSTPSTAVGTDQEMLLGNSNQPQPQLAMQSKSFVIRPGQSKLTYTQALDLYKNNLLQFNENCQLSLGNRSFQVGNEVMIDNRSSRANTFVVGGTLLAIAPYDFGFMILKEKGDAVPVDCGDRKNIAILVVQ